MRAVYLAVSVMLFAGYLAACDKAEIRQVVSDAEVAGLVAGADKQGISVSPESVRAALDREGCNIVFANGIGNSDPHVIVAGDTTPANDVARYYRGLPEKDRKAVEDAVYERASKSFICVDSRAKQKTCSKDVRISYGSGHLPKLGKDVYIIQPERSCRCS